MLASFFFLISNNSEIELGWGSLPLVPVSISCTCKHQLNLHASKRNKQCTCKMNSVTGNSPSRVCFKK